MAREGVVLASGGVLVVQQRDRLLHLHIRPCLLCILHRQRLCGGVVGVVRWWCVAGIALGVFDSSCDEDCCSGGVAIVLFL